MGPDTPLQNIGGGGYPLPPGHVRRAGHQSLPLPYAIVLLEAYWGGYSPRPGNTAELRPSSSNSPGIQPGAFVSCIRALLRGLGLKKAGCHLRLLSKTLAVAVPRALASGHIKSRPGAAFVS